MAIVQARNKNLYFCIFIIKILTLYCRAADDAQQGLLSSQQVEQQYEQWWFHDGGQLLFEDACDEPQGSRGGIDHDLYTQERPTIGVDPWLGVSPLQFRDMQKFQGRKFWMYQGGYLNAEKTGETISLPANYIAWVDEKVYKTHSEVIANNKRLAGVFELTLAEKANQPMLPNCAPGNNFTAYLDRIILERDMSYPLEMICMERLWYSLQLIELYTNTLAWQRGIIDRVLKEKGHVPSQKVARPQKGFRKINAKLEKIETVGWTTIVFKTPHAHADGFK